MIGKCAWCGCPFVRRDGGIKQRFCRTASCKRHFDAAAHVLGSAALTGLAERHTGGAREGLARLAQPASTPSSATHTLPQQAAE